MPAGKYIRTKEIRKKNKQGLLGRKIPEEIKKKISQSHKGEKFSEERKKRISKALKGRTYSKETLKKMSLVKLGKKLSKETKKKIKESTKGKINLNERNGMWKGDRIQKGGEAVHNWVHRRKLKPKFCEECKKVSPYDLANISGKYKRDVNDFRWLCRKCHMLSDGRLKFPTI